MIYDMYNINERIEELEALEAKAEDFEGSDGAKELNNLREFVEKVGKVDENVVDAILEYYAGDSDILETVGNIIKDGEYSLHEDGEEYGRYLVENLEPEVPMYIRSYVDFEGFAQDSLSGSNYTETSDGQIIIFY